VSDRQGSRRWPVKIMKLTVEIVIKHCNNGYNNEVTSDTGYDGHTSSFLI